MKFAYKLFINTALALSLVACQDDSNSTVEMGWMDINVTAAPHEMAPPIGPFALTVATADGEYSHTWASATQFPKYENFIVGQYTARAVSGTPGAEGYDCQCYIGEANFEVMPGQSVGVPILCELQQAIARVEIGDGLAGRYPGCSATLHTSGYGYVAIDPEAEGPVLIMPGFSYLYLTLPHQNEDVTLACDFSVETMAATAYKIDLDMEGETLTITSGPKQSQMLLSEDLFSTPAPEVEANGFVSGETISLVEGNKPSAPIEMIVSAEAGLQSVILTAVSEGGLSGMPREVNLLDIPADADLHGLKIRKDGDNALAVDYTNLLANLAVEANTDATFMLMARDRLGRVSQASILKVGVQSVELLATEFTPAMVGVNTTTVTLKCNTGSVQLEDFSAYLLDPNTGKQLDEAPIVSLVADKEQQTGLLTLDIGPGVVAAPLRIDYLGQPKLWLTIPRAVPEYKLTADAFARTAVLAVEAETPEITAAIVDNASVLANGEDVEVVRRIPESGIIAIAGLDPCKTYALQSMVVKGSYAPIVRVRTEDALPVPDGDFEDVGVPSEYKDLEQGGPYSASEFPIYNMQNFTTLKVAWTQKYWANVNAKTFCRSAKRYNTWYMQPSSQLDYDYYVSGSKSMRITSVGWSLDGPEIQPYLQDRNNYLPYNANVPVVEHRSAGKLFLGEYRFNPSDLSESYIEGLKFSSRPSSLNGFYKYTPDKNNPNDNGLVSVEVISEDNGFPTVIAFATMRLSPTRDFITFNLPLEYSSFGVKATKIKIMFSSSYKTGTIEEEDAGVTATPDIPEAVYRGSVLWIDNLSFSY
ncbi:MAG: DUF4493 domain-containing protein [Muribaculaceae bacterium]|nr:DUF4493 domain-containing protein [Muribaculaceae bacterium]